MILHIHFVALFKRFILANSFGECIFAYTYVLPTDIQGLLRASINGCIGPVPAEETLVITEPKISLTAF